MANLLSDASHWHRRATEMRALADDMADSESKRVILEIADGYDRLAQRADVREHAVTMMKTPDASAQRRPGRS